MKLNATVMLIIIKHEPTSDEISVFSTVTDHYIPIVEVDVKSN